MSTPASPVVAAAPIHPAWYARAISWLVGVGKAVKAGIAKVASEAPKVDAAIKEYAPTVEAVSELFAPGSSKIEALAVDALGAVVSAVEGAGDAAAANGVSVSLDAQLVADVKAILPAIKAFLHPAASAAPPAK